MSRGERLIGISNLKKKLEGHWQLSWSRGTSQHLNDWEPRMDSWLLGAENAEYCITIFPIGNVCKYAGICLGNPKGLFLSVLSGWWVLLELRLPPIMSPKTWDICLRWSLKVFKNNTFTIHGHSNRTCNEKLEVRNFSSKRYADIVVVILGTND